MVGQSVETGAGAASFIEQSVQDINASDSLHCENLQASGVGAIHSWGTNSRVDRNWGWASVCTTALVTTIKAESFIVNDKKNLCGKRIKLMLSLLKLGLCCNEAEDRAVSYIHASGIQDSRPAYHLRFIYIR